MANHKKRKEVEARISEKENSIRGAFSKKVAAPKEHPLVMRAKQIVTSFGDTRVLGKSPERIATEILKSGLGKWPAPAWLYSLALYSTDSSVLNLLTSIKRGGSVYKTLQALQPSALVTRKQATFITEPPKGFSFREVLWWMKIRSFGGTRAQAATWSKELAEKVAPNKTWDTYVEWLVRHKVRDFGPIVDFLLMHPGFDISGRTEASVTRLVTDWHTKLAQEKGSEFQWKPSKFRNLEMNSKDELGEERHIKVQEILSGQELAKEGRVMKHCVYSYLRYLKEGQYFIFQILQSKPSKPNTKLEYVSIGTIRLTPQGHVCEARGKMNSPLCPMGRKAYLAWCKLNNLVPGRWGD